MNQETEKSSSAKRRGRPTLMTFVIAQLLLAGVVLGAITIRGTQLKQQTALPPLREEPLEVAPLYDYEVVVSDEQLRRVLYKLRPQFNGKDTLLARVDHNLRFWSAKATFDDPTYPSGEDLRQLLVSHGRFAGLYGPDERPLLMDVPGGGVRYREMDGKATSSHDDHTMACLAEAGTPLNFPIKTPQGETTFRAVVEQSLRDFSLNQAEYEWSALTYALFVEADRWLTSEGQEVSFDMLAHRIMRQRLPQGVCFGNHRLHTLTMLLRVDEEHQKILSPEVRQEVLDFLLEQTALLVRHQHADGFWNRDWPFKKADNSKPSDEVGDRLGDRIIATGHALEWWALAPAELHPPRHVIVNAAQWIVKTVDGLTEDGVRDNNSFLSHAGRALALWRGKYPHEVDLSGEAPTTKQTPMTNQTDEQQE